MTKGRPCRSWQELVQVIGTSDSFHFWQCLLFSVCSISLTKYRLYASVMLSIYAELLSRLLAVLTRERAAAHMQGTALTLARLKIVSTIKNLYHIQCQCVGELGSSV